MAKPRINKTLWLSPREERALRAAVELEDMSASSFMREAVLAKVREVLREERLRKPEDGDD